MYGLQTCREKLIRLLVEADVKAENAMITDYQEAVADNADYLLSKGVFVPPCNIGDTIYVIPSKVNYELNKINGLAENNRVYRQKVNEIRILKDSAYMLVTCDGLFAVHSDSLYCTWFLSYEKAQEKLEVWQSYESVKK